ncbi:hypothetical protein K7X08_014675 [Anisodus acutangulus]|uniref:Transmembrane protein n=1 Tax=Anisodus acutangulus TaxID=402998 RepID=A0A9Q1R346_9SOLA|nr:hypothetical protein K7X08_014675 [Anisodus acutangulus]
MAISKLFQFFVVLILLVLMMITTASLEANRVILQHPQRDYSKMFSTIGLDCKCCDDAGGECTKSWHGTCSNFQCSPWKQYSFRIPT